MARGLNSVWFYDSVVAIEKLQSEAPTSLISTNGQVTASRRALDVRGRKSVFAGKNGS